MALPAKKDHDTRTLHASAATAAGAVTAAADAERLPLAPNGYTFVLDVTNAATDAADTLDVYIETRIDDGAENWLDVVHFTQVLGNGSDTLQYIEKLTSAATEAGYEVGTGLAAGTVRNIAGDEWRVRWVQVDADTNGTFTFSVTVCAM